MGGAALDVLNTRNTKRLVRNVLTTRSTVGVVRVVWVEGGIGPGVNELKCSVLLGCV